MSTKKEGVDRIIFFFTCLPFIHTLITDPTFKYRVAEKNRIHKYRIFSQDFYVNLVNAAFNQKWVNSGLRFSLTSRLNTFRQ